MRFLLLLLAVTTLGYAQPSSAQLAWQDCHISGYTPKVVCFEADLPLSETSDETIKVSATLVPALSRAKETPLLIFTGGPGQAGSDLGPFINAAFHEIRKTRDLVLIDQRGTGKTSAVTCAEFFPENATEFSLTKLASDCLQSAESLPIQSFTLESVVADAAHFIRLLGYQKVNIWGGSYGTRSAALFYRRYPELTRALILDGVLPPQTRLFESSPLQAQRALELLISDCMQASDCATAFPNLKTEIEQLLNQFSREERELEFQDPLTGEVTQLTLNSDFIANMIRTALYTPSQAAMIPITVQQANRGNFNPLFALFQNSAGAAETMALGATLSILCSDEVPRINPSEATGIGPDTFTNNGYYRYWSSGCHEWPMAPSSQADFTTLTGEVPVLALSGEHDPITGPELGQELINHLTNGFHIVVKNSGHNVSHLKCMPTIMANYLDHLQPRELDTSCLDNIERPAFVVSTLGPNVEAQP